MKNPCPFTFSFFLFWAIFLAGMIPNVSAHVYKRADDSGGIRVSAPPSSAIQVQQVQGVSDGTKTEAVPAAPGGPPETANPEGQKVKVILYMTDWCRYCRMAKSLLQSLDVDLVEYNVEKNREKYAEFKTKGGRGVPLIDVEGILIKGYNPEIIKAAVDKKRKR